jgi:hypothetical protein
MEKHVTSTQLGADGMPRQPFLIIVAGQMLRRSHEFTWVQSMVGAEGQPRLAPPEGRG